MEKEKNNSILKNIEGKGFGKTIWSPIGRAMHKYNMVEAGDRIAVGVSGGKDSMTTLNALVRVKKIAQIDFEIIPIHIHPNTDKASYEKIEKYCEELGLKLQVESTNLSDMLFGEKEVKNPCFLCGRIRRGILYRMMKEQNINKLALGHHKVDIIRYVKKQELPVVASDCPYETSENSKRLRVKNLIKELAQENKDVRSVVFNSIKEMLD